MRALAALIDDERPTAFAVCEIDAGDAFSLATRFAVQWAYRGRQALFWNGDFTAHRVRDLYLPLRGTHLFDRRGLLRVDATYEGRDCTLVTTQFSSERDGRVPELRFARKQLRTTAQNAVFFAHLDDRSIGFEDLGFRDATGTPESKERVYLRGFDSIEPALKVATI